MTLHRWALDSFLKTPSGYQSANTPANELFMILGTSVEEATLFEDQDLENRFRLNKIMPS